MYFVAYENRQKNKPAFSQDPPLIMNALIDVHPLVWVDQTTEAYRQYFVTYIHFWAEVPDDIAQQCKGVHCESSPNPFRGHDPNVLAASIQT